MQNLTTEIPFLSQNRTVTHLSSSSIVPHGRAWPITSHSIPQTHGWSITCTDYSIFGLIVSHWIVTLLKVTDSPIQVCDIYLTVSFKFFNFSSQIFLLFDPEIFSSFKSYMISISTLLWFGFCNQSILTCFLSYKNH